MKFALLIYNEEAVVESLQAEGTFDGMMRECFDHVDELAEKGKWLGAQQLESTSKAKSVRVRKGKTTVLDGPFAETKEMLAGFNIVEADSIEEAIEMAAHFPWAQVGTIEVRPLRDLGDVKSNVRSGRAAWAE